MKKIFLIAGEASGDVLGAKLMIAMKEQEENILFYGIGGPKMAQEGLSSLFDMNELSIMGFFEIITKLLHINSRINYTVSQIKKILPDIVITIDSPGFCFRVAAKIKHLNLRLIHYVAPSVWAYKPERAKKIASIYDHLLTLLPFEPKYFTDEGLNATFVGHPIIEDKLGNGAIFRLKHKIDPNDKLLCIMPGSRIQELEKLLPIFVETTRILMRKVSNLNLVVISLPHLAPMVQKAFGENNIKIIITTSDQSKIDALAASNAALVKSGTSSLEVAFAKVPMIVAYKINELSAWFVKRILKISYVSLVNIIMDKKIIPELLQEDCNAENLAKELEELLNNADSRNSQISNFASVFKQLKNGKSSPSTQAAKIILGS
ncbi:Lipid-A-disaccharide synthase [Candidatus Arcanobacter lacustris]|jgi:lipid-A-disaccharide synthase|uniref:Lipid-A-disaccharide synthase n=1 Tax=Candidatus Arcanibacter lacustris TaxID=1607817 RepID=A0A0F5MQ90_9RICK|nr:Lipid-A-disaccharide synthase [Candidatus Arcanobacter lacustris]